MWFKWRRDKSDEIDLAELDELIITDPAVRYANCLLIQASRQPEQEYVLRSTEPLPPAENYEGELPEFQAVADRFREMCVTGSEDENAPKTGHIDLVIGGQPLVVHVRLVNDDSGQALYYRTEFLPIPKVPEAIWRQVSARPDDELVAWYDIRLRSCLMLEKIAIMRDGRLVGVHLREGRYWDFTGTVDFEPNEITAIRRRSGSFMNRLGLTRWYKLPDA